MELRFCKNKYDLLSDLKLGDAMKYYKMMSCSSVINPSSTAPKHLLMFCLMLNWN